MLYTTLTAQLNFFAKLKTIQNLFRSVCVQGTEKTPFIEKESVTHSYYQFHKRKIQGAYTKLYICIILIRNNSE